MSRFLIVNTDYSRFLTELYAGHPGLEHASYEKQLAVRNGSLFGVSDFYPRNLVDLGHPAVEFSINNRSLQTAWAREHGLKLPAASTPRLVLRRGILPWLVRDRAVWMEQVLAAQIEEFRPDVVLTHSLSDLRPAFWRRMRNHYRLLVGQIASPLSTDIDLTPFDLMLSSLPNFVERFRQAGLARSCSGWRLIRWSWKSCNNGKQAMGRSRRLTFPSSAAFRGIMRVGWNGWKRSAARRPSRFGARESAPCRRIPPFVRRFEGRPGELTCLISSAARGFHSTTTSAFRARMPTICGFTKRRGLVPCS